MMAVVVVVGCRGFIAIVIDVGESHNSDNDSVRPKLAAIKPKPRWRRSSYGRLAGQRMFGDERNTIPSSSLALSR